MTEEPRTRPWADEKPSREALIVALAKCEGELAARERELAEAPRREAATAAVINVISRSKVDLDVVLTTLTDAARTLCGAAGLFTKPIDFPELRVMIDQRIESAMGPA